ncbi:pentapeptide repeat-containing protein [Streptomyces microflavus]|uniref:pentapeptide repeat-containing protein n=1 Tax=Streptomyces griseus group TaxID=629295 RepID=UPI00364E6003
MQSFIALGGLIALLYTARNYNLARRGQTTERFVKALAHLGSSRLYVRVGGILAIEQLSVDTPEQSINTERVLRSFVRRTAPRTAAFLEQEVALEQATLPSVPSDDIQAALTFLGNSSIRHPGNTLLPGLALENLHLAGAVLPQAHFRGSRIHQCDLSAAILDGATFFGAWLTGTNLSLAQLTGADMTNAILEQVDLSHCVLRYAILPGASLQGSRLDHADFRGAVGLTAGQVCEAIPTRTVILPSDLEGNPQIDTWKRMS